MNPEEMNSTLEALRRALEGLDAGQRPSEFLLRSALTENWFTNVLSWMLDPGAAHGLGDAFLCRFLRAIAIRAREDDGPDGRSDSLRFGAKSTRVSLSDLRLENAAIVREFFLSSDTTYRYGGRRSRRADVVIFDLDPNDMLFIIIENKLFGADERGQLEDYVSAVREKFSKRGTLKVREHVFLSLFPATPKESSKKVDEWRTLSWTTDVREALKGAIEDVGRDAAREVGDILQFLNWVEKCRTASDVLWRLRDTVRAVCARVLLTNLQDLAAEGTVWFQDENDPLVIRCKGFKRHLRVSLLADGTVVLVFRINRAEDKILVPWCVHPSQVFNLVRSTARDVYYRFFHDSEDPERHLSRKRFTQPAAAGSDDQRNLFEFLYKHRFELPFLMGIASAENAEAARADADGIDLVNGDPVNHTPTEAAFSDGNADHPSPPES